MKLIHGDCIEVMEGMDDNSVDSIVTDPPYELGFMGKSWDASGIAYNVDVWRECLRVLKPGGHLLAFGGTRTYHRMACAIEDAGFEIRDMIEWVYGSGFPKSHNISKAIDKVAGAEREVIGDNPHSCKGRKPGVLHIAGGNHRPKMEEKMIEQGIDKPPITAPATPEAQQWDGWGTALKPSHEPICVARKPLSERTIAANVLEWGTGGINVDACRVGSETRPVMVRTDTIVSASSMAGASTGATCSGDNTTQGRWPANLILTIPENEFIMKRNLTKEQRDELFKWLQENA